MSGKQHLNFIYQVKHDFYLTSSSSMYHPHVREAVINAVQQNRLELVNKISKKKHVSTYNLH